MYLAMFVVTLIIAFGIDCHLRRTFYPILENILTNQQNKMLSETKIILKSRSILEFSIRKWNQSLYSPFITNQCINFSKCSTLWWQEGLRRECLTDKTHNFSSSKLRMANWLVVLKLYVISESQKVIGLICGGERNEFIDIFIDSFTVSGFQNTCNDCHNYPVMTKVTEIREIINDFSFSESNFILYRCEKFVWTKR